MTSAYLLRLGAIANCHLLLSQLYSELLTVDSLSRRKYELDLEIFDTRQLLTELTRTSI
jgi:hypothetical protein